MGKVTFTEERCKGCELCTTVCPVKIVVMADKINSKGFRPATVSDMKKCIACAACARICPDAVIEVEK
ncbi:MAG: hypothetical protein FD169_375 [Bacillota bacterium]|nr:MAG: hypothetical protein FD169_375 [Bacillota bacterium]